MLATNEERKERKEATTATYKKIMDLLSSRETPRRKKYQGQDFYIFGGKLNFVFSKYIACRKTDWVTTTSVAIVISIDQLVVLSA